MDYFCRLDQFTDDRGILDEPSLSPIKLFDMKPQHLYFEQRRQLVNILHYFEYQHQLHRFIIVLEKQRMKRVVMIHRYSHSNVMN